MSKQLPATFKLFDGNWDPYKVKEDKMAQANLKSSCMFVYMFLEWLPRPNRETNAAGLFLPKRKQNIS